MPRLAGSLKAPNFDMFGVPHYNQSIDFYGDIMPLDFGKKNLIAYLTAGFPDMEFTSKALLEFQELGVNAIEIGVPYTDPVADGPVIAEASYRSLQNGTNLDWIFKMLAGIRDRIRIPVYLMSYYSPVFTYGEDKFIEGCVKTGVTGSIIPDLSLDEGGEFFKKEKKNGLDPILLVFPNTPEGRIRKIAEVTGSFIYCVNFFGTTGVRNVIPESAYSRLKEVRDLSGKPVCAGFGVSSGDDFRKFSLYGDGVIIASAIMKRLLDRQGEPDRGLGEVTSFLKSVLGVKAGS